MHPAYAAFPDEQACRDALARARWPDGFVCPACGHDDATTLARRGLRQCRACRRQTSITAGTALQSSKAPLRAWLYTVWRLDDRRARLSARALMRELGVGSYETAWVLLHKVRAAIASSSHAVERGAVEILYARLPAAVVAKRSRAGSDERALLVLARDEVRAACGPVTRESDRPAPRARRFLAHVAATLAVVHRGVSAAYLPHYVRALVVAFNGHRVVEVGDLARAPPRRVAALAA